MDEIMNIMDTIEYGFKNEYGKNLVEDEIYWEENFDKFYHLQSPEELLKSKCGVCWDQVELERKLFEEKNIEVKTYFIFIKEDDMLPSHTFLTYMNNDKYYWFEHSWNDFKGIHEYENIDDLFDDVTKKFRISHIEVKPNSPLYIYEYTRPNYGISCNEFYKFIESTKLIKEITI